MTEKITVEQFEKIKNLASRIYPKDNFEGHIIPVVKISCNLAIELNADYKVCEIAAYMHDAGRVLYDCENHDVTGAKYTNDMLTKFRFPELKIKHISDCVLTHRGRSYNPETIEAEIITNADALSHFEGAFYMFGIHFSNCKNASNTINWLLTKLDFDLKNKFSIKQAKDRATLLLSDYIKPLLDITKEVMTL